ncbi:MAG: biosynthetic-type acetolactate synthase large subunit [Candidatus Omnitrophica bacterium]|nr:biosynthetic-type acetolactate synthase large subunit [Candidatus Omnitrophota bacterium]
MATMTGSEILIECLKRENVEVMFGYPGGSVIPIFDTLYSSDIRFILVRHEQGAAHMADGYARATGKVGVCIATSGPGATNLVTGIATAYMDSIPMVALTGQVKTHLIGNDAFQEADMVGITRPITKHNYLVKDVKNLARVIREAFHIASTGRPGPVLVDIPVDITLASCKFEYPAQVDIRSYKPVVYGHPRQIKKAVDLINQAKRPLFYVGGGVIISGASAELTTIARKLSVPVTTTLNALGSFPENDPLSLGMLGMHGTAYANHAVQGCDLLISVGARFDDRVTGKIDEFAPHAKIIHIDIDPSSISKTVRVDLPIVGDAKNVLKELIKQVKPLKIKPWLRQVAQWKEKYPLQYKKDSKTIKPQYVIEVVCKLTKGDAIVVTEVGQNQMWAAQWYEYTKPRTFLSSGGLGTMGYGFPAAIGAQIGMPEKTVIDIAGDGSIQMNIQELSTAVANKIPVKVIILNNGYLGMVRQWQELFYGKRYAHTDLQTTGNPDFMKIAEAYGALGIRVTKNAEVEPAIKKALKHNGPVFVDVIIDREENVFPMVPAGQAIDRMIGGMA